MSDLPNVDDTAEEKEFRNRYALELQKKRVVRHISPHFGIDELDDELQRIRYQELATPGRRGEQIKHEEINKEILRRTSLIQLSKGL